jgi:hypothetical protein
MLINVVLLRVWKWLCNKGFWLWSVCSGCLLWVQFNKSWWQLGKSNSCHPLNVSGYCSGYWSITGVFLISALYRNWKLDHNFNCDSLKKSILWAYIKPSLLMYTIQLLTLVTHFFWHDRIGCSVLELSLCVYIECWQLKFILNQNMCLVVNDMWKYWRRHHWKWCHVWKLNVCWHMYWM